MSEVQPERKPANRVTAEIIHINLNRNTVGKLINLDCIDICDQLTAGDTRKNHNAQHHCQRENKFHFRAIGHISPPCKRSGPVKSAAIKPYQNYSCIIASI